MPRNRKHRRAPRARGGPPRTVNTRLEHDRQFDVKTFVFKEFIGISAPAILVVETLTLIFNADCNGWSWATKINGTLSDSNAAYYGETTGQFASLAALYSQYSVKSVDVRIIPS